MTAVRDLFEPGPGQAHAEQLERLGRLVTGTHENDPGILRRGAAAGKDDQ